MLSAVVTGNCFPGFPPNSLRDEGEEEGEGGRGVVFDWRESREGGGAFEQAVV